MGLSVEGLSFSYRNFDVLKDVSFSAPKGEITTVIGPNGAGKTTLLKSIAGILEAQGTVKIDGRDRESYPKRQFRRMLSYMTQGNSSTSSLSVFEVVLLGRVQTLSLRVQKEDISKTWAILREMSISDLAERPFKKLSGGQQRLVSIAQTLVCDPKVLILDEPTANLDLQNELEVLELIGRYTVSRETTTIMTLHDLNMAARHSQKLVLLKSGRVWTQGAPDHVLSERTIEETYGVLSRLIKGSKGETMVFPMASVRA
ncbi:MAG: ABC transporter ATP-binding protein [Synergistales bacterium]|nr:ABC transporter ATP-binding protein [Dethiosulfovibrio sp.]NCC96554.1 ABC transporter ATP-binding protein [Synergistales bacterium]